jgi:hypothetical protein
LIDISLLPLQVYKGLHEGVHEVAIKVLVDWAADVQRHQSFMREVELLKSCRHSHIVQVVALSGKRQCQM